jgi:hypothetical protein
VSSSLHFIASLRLSSKKESRGKRTLNVEAGDHMLTIAPLSYALSAVDTDEKQARLKEESRGSKKEKGKKEKRAKMP